MMSITQTDNTLNDSTRIMPKCLESFNALKHVCYSTSLFVVLFSLFVCRSLPLFKSMLRIRIMLRDRKIFKVCFLCAFCLSFPYTH